MCRVARYNVSFERMANFNIFYYTCMQHSTFVIGYSDIWMFLPRSEHEAFQCTPLSQTDSHAADEVYSWPPQVLVAYLPGSVKGTDSNTNSNYVYYYYSIIRDIIVYGHGCRGSCTWAKFSIQKVRYVTIYCYRFVSFIFHLMEKVRPFYRRSVVCFTLNLSGKAMVSKPNEHAIYK